MGTRRTHCQSCGKCGDENEFTWTMAKKTIRAHEKKSQRKVGKGPRTFLMPTLSTLAFAISSCCVSCRPIQICILASKFQKLSNERKEWEQFAHRNFAKEKQSQSRCEKKSKTCKQCITCSHFHLFCGCQFFLVSCFLFLIIVTLNLFTLTDPSLLFFNQHCTQSTLHTINTTHRYTREHAKNKQKKQQCMQTYTLCSIGAALTSSIEPNRTRICRIFS